MKRITRFFFQETLGNNLNDRPNSFNFLFLIILFTSLQFSALKTEASFSETTFEPPNINVFADAQDIRELKPGETVERQAKTAEVHGYQITLEAGTSVEINFGKRAMSFNLAVILPDNHNYSVPGQQIPTGKEFARVIVAAGNELTETFIIVAEKTDKYVLKARFWDAGTYAISCGLPRPTTEKDRRYAAAEKLFSEIRQALESGTALDKLQDKFEQRAEIYRTLDDKISLAMSLNDVARVFRLKADWGKALRHYREALEIFRSLNSPKMISYNLIEIGRISSQIRDYQTAIDSFTESLTVARTLGNKRDESSSLHMLGVCFHLLADEVKAREFYEQSLAVNRSISPPTVDSLSGQGVTLTNIGNLYRGMSYGEIPIDSFSPRTVEDRQKAIDYYKKAIEFWKKVTELNPKVSTLEIFNLQQIGNAYKELGVYTEALSYLNTALERYRAGKGKGGETNVLISIGNLYVLKGEHRKSFQYFEEALQNLREGEYNVNQVEYLNNIAQDYYRAGETRKALDIYSESLTLSKTRGQQEVAAQALYEIARIERDLGNFNNSRSRIEEAIQIAEAMRAAITAQEVRTTYFSNVKRYYDFYVDLLMQAHKSQPEKGFEALALQMSEKARSRSLLDLLALSKVDIKQGVDSKLLEREKLLRQQLSEKANQQSRLLLGKYTLEEAEKIQKEIAALTNEFESVQSEIKNKSPRYAALAQTEPLNAKQTQQLLDSGTILLEYSLGEKKSYLWAVSNDSIKSFDLASRTEIEIATRRVYELLTARNQNLPGESDEQKRARVKTAEDEYPKAAARLSEMLLGQIAEQIGNKRLLIVADGALNYISFAALPLPKTGENAGWQSLGTNHEIVTLPSASILALLREETATRKPAPKMLAVFADPVFNQTDVRANLTNKAKKPANEISQLNGKLDKPSFSRDFERAVSDVGLRASGGLPRLPFSRREADSIFRVSPRNLSLKEIDFDASKANVFGSNLNQYRILHFATHGLLNSQHPELSGLVLSLVDRSGSEIDGFVRLQDIYNLKLSADLVVLSACQTALGKDVKGEGLISLTRGFMYAGAPRVVASLWKVDDAATAELMSIFYRKMLVENLRPAAALRAAQIEMMQQKRWKSPYYWAAFTIQGEWR